MIKGIIKWLENFKHQKKQNFDHKKRKMDEVSVSGKDSDYIIKDTDGNIVHFENRMAHYFHPDYKRLKKSRIRKRRSGYSII